MAKAKVKPRKRPTSRAPAGKMAAPFLAFDAGKSQRRLKALPTAPAAINAQIKQYGRTVLARSRYLAANNPYAAQAKETFVSALVGCGIKPSSLIKDAPLKQALQEAFSDWTDQSDADHLTDFYGQEAIVAGEMFEAGECFVRLRARRDGDGLNVPLQLQLLPAEMLPIEHNVNLGSGNVIQMGIEFDAIGRRVAYHFLRQHPYEQITTRINASMTTRVPASEVLHLYKPIRAGQIRGIPHTLSAIAKLALMDQYDDAELERKKTAALFSIFIKRDQPQQTFIDKVAEDKAKAASGDGTATVDLQPGSSHQLLPGEDIAVAEPADVGNSYEAFQYRTLLAIAAGFGVPYAAMTGDLRQTSYGSIRAGLVEFRRRVEAMQHGVMVFQFCRPVWQRWLNDAVLAGAIPIAPGDFLKRKAELARVKWITPKWEWIDPQKDLEAEKLAVDNGFKARSDVIEASGYDPEETDARIAADQARAERLGLKLKADAPQATLKPADGVQDDEATPVPGKENGNVRYQ